MASSSWVKHSCRDRDIYHAQVRKTGPSPVRGSWVATNIGSGARLALAPSWELL